MKQLFKQLANANINLCGTLNLKLDENYKWVPGQSWLFAVGNEEPSLYIDEDNRAYVGEIVILEGYEQEIQLCSVDVNDLIADKQKHVWYPIKSALPVI